MTEPGDDMEEALRRALAEAADGVEPGPDGLDAIRARIGDRKPRPWLLSVAFHLVERLRSWCGRWSWPWPARGRAASPGRPPGPERTPGQQRSPGPAGPSHPDWARLGPRLAAGLAGLAVLAGVSFGVQPFRQAIIDTSTGVLNGGGNPREGTPGGDSTGTGGGALLDGASPARPGQGGMQGATGTGPPGHGSPAGCVIPRATPSPGGTPTSSRASGKPTPTTSSPPAAETITASRPATSPPAISPSPSLTPTATPDPSATAVWTCPVTGPAETPTPTPTGSATSEPPATATASPPAASDAPTPTPTTTPAPGLSDGSPGSEPTSTASGPDGPAGRTAR